MYDFMPNYPIFSIFVLTQNLCELKHLFASFVLLSFFLCPIVASERDLTFNNSWRFSLGDASSMQADFTHGTEYFTYVCKVASTWHNHGPADPSFDDSLWQEVNLPHDWVVDLPYSPEASHSHGYKCIGWRYPQNSVGWYRKHFYVPAEAEGSITILEFDGVWRDGQVFCNGIYLGGERSGYLSHWYDLSDVLDYGADNVITVRCDASLEEGWFYEGAGIYRNVRLRREGCVALRPYSLRITPSDVDFETILRPGLDSSRVSSRISFLGPDGKQIPSMTRRWSPEDPYLYTVRVELFYDGVLQSVTDTPYGLRDISFGPDGLVLDGQNIMLKGCNIHQDAAGVGTGVPDALWEYRISRLKEFGFNAIRISHNPASPALLDICDRLGMLVIAEARQMGSGPEQLRQLDAMVRRDRNHPCIILWSIGNEEWAVETGPKGQRLAASMIQALRPLDSRPTTYGQCSGAQVQIADVVDVPGYNYIVQNHMDDDHAARPQRSAVGTEETSGAGTRGKYFTDKDKGWMLPLNLDASRDTTAFAIERGWKYFKARPWAAGVFYWTGYDYRGEPNPMVWPATGSQFGILDYCGFPKDEAWYLRSWWTEDPVLHLCGPVDGVVTVYSNCDAVTLFAGRRSLGRKEMPLDGHLCWAVPAGAEITAKGYKKGAKPLVAALDRSPVLSASASKETLIADGQDMLVIEIDTPESEQALEVIAEGVELLGWGNGDPAFKTVERPLDGRSLTIESFSHKAQVLIRSKEGVSGSASVHIGSISLGIEVR